jgi:glycosyltransferase involved in cell wall biosynthesis
MKVTYVVPRYGVEIVGGAESAARLFAEGLAARPGWEVDVVTTCALDANTWADEYAPGEVEINGVRVRRFRSTHGRRSDFPAAQARALQAPSATTAGDQQWFVDAQGPVNPSLIDAIRAGDADLTIFYPYLFWTTVHGVAAAPGPVVMHPAAHDEAPIRLAIYKPVFEGVDGLVFQTRSERAFAHRRFRIGATPQLLLGVGCEEGDGAPEVARAALGLGDRPYLVSVARIDRAKGYELLVDLFAAYKRRRPGPLALVLVGQVVEPPPPHPDVVVTGPVSDDVKWGALRGSLATVSPSAYEAFSRLVIEGWSAGVPVVVNGRCHPTREHCEVSGGGLWFESYADFEVVIDRLIGDARLRSELARRGRSYVDANFRWPDLIDRYSVFLERVAARRRS